MCTTRDGCAKRVAKNILLTGTMAPNLGLTLHWTELNHKGLRVEKAWNWEPNRMTGLAFLWGVNQISEFVIPVRKKVIDTSSRMRISTYEGLFIFSRPHAIHIVGQPCLGIWPISSSLLHYLGRRLGNRPERSFESLSLEVSIDNILR